MRHIENHVAPNGTKVELFIYDAPTRGGTSLTIEGSYYTEDGHRHEKAVVITSAASATPFVELSETLEMGLLRFILDKAADWRERQNQAVTPE